MALFVGGSVPAIQKYVLHKEPTDLIEALQLAKKQELIGIPDEILDMLALKIFFAEQKTEPKTVAQLSASPIPCLWFGHVDHFIGTCPDAKMFLQPHHIHISINQISKMIFRRLNSTTIHYLDFPRRMTIKR